MTRYLFPLIFVAVLRAQLPTDTDISAILTERIDKLHQNVGIVVGVIDASGRCFVSRASINSRRESR